MKPVVGLRFSHASGNRAIVTAVSTGRIDSIRYVVDASQTVTLGYGLKG